MAAFKLLVLQVESKEMCTLSCPDSLRRLRYTPPSAGSQPGSLSSQEMMERVCVVRDGQGSFPDFFLDIRVELRKSRFACLPVLFTELCRTLF